jgi:hypothetical protein
MRYNTIRKREGNPVSAEILKPKGRAQRQNPEGPERFPSKGKKEKEIKK